MERLHHNYDKATNNRLTKAKSIATPRLRTNAMANEPPYGHGIIVPSLGYATLA